MKKIISMTVCMVFFTVFHAHATTIEKLTFEEMVHTSALIIEGEVDSVYMVESGNTPFTRVVINIHEVLKGDYLGEFIELDFMGGNLEGKTLTISGQDIPKNGESGFYFIENPSSKSVNPLTGWSQGHFRILSDREGNKLLETDIKQGVVELSDNKSAAMAAKLKNMKFDSSQVEKAYFSPVTPEQLRNAVQAYLP